MPRGRPKGSKNKKTLLEETGKAINPGIQAKEPEKASQELSKAEKKDLKKQYRELRRLKKGLKPGSPERIDIGRKMKEIKERLAGQVVNSQKPEVIEEKTFASERDRLVEGILAEMKRVNSNVLENFWRRFWSKPCFTEESLKEHLDIWKKKGL